ncbi:MAG: recombinase zinc beta ribbon domain-containing protein [Candidatus Omnitrophica bacterium]|nr:recombinase zinc beta ribbon domain-containing protein [Candidatus Omnitrophota bacterium]
MRMLKNHTYIGKANYNGQIYQGLHPAIIDEETFRKVNEKLAHNRLDRKPYKNKDCAGLLSKVLKCKACGSSMIHTYTLKKGRHKYRYYLCCNAQKRGYSECPVRYVNAQQAEERIIQILRGEVKNIKNSPHKADVEAILSPIWNTLFFEEQRRIIQILIQRADYDSAAKKIGIVINGIPERMEFDSNIKKIHAKGRDAQKRQLGQEPPVRKSLLLAHHLNTHLTEGKIEDLNQAAAWMGFTQSQLSHILGLLHLSPAIQTEIIDGDSKSLYAIPEYKLRDLSSKINWTRQSELWTEIKSTHS